MGTGKPWGYSCFYANDYKEAHYNGAYNNDRNTFINPTGPIENKKAHNKDNFNTKSNTYKNKKTNKASNNEKNIQNNTIQG